MIAEYGVKTDADFTNMTAIKKNKTKTKAPAPAAKVKSVARQTSTEVKTTPVKTAPAAAARKFKPAVKIVAAKPVLTMITAKIDIGFGNVLYIRGEAPGLSWDKGLAMSCGSADEWQCVLSEVARPVTFKLLVNDLTWSAGPDFTVEAGATSTLTPEF